MARFLQPEHPVPPRKVRELLIRPLLRVFGLLIRVLQPRIRLLLQPLIRRPRQGRLMRHPSRTNRTNRIGPISLTSTIITTGTMIKTVITMTGMMMIGAVKIVTIAMEAAITGLAMDQAGTTTNRIRSNAGGPVLRCRLIDEVIGSARYPAIEFWQTTCEFHRLQFYDPQEFTTA